MRWLLGDHAREAIFLTILLFVAIRAPVEFLWRPNFETPVTVSYSVDQQNPLALSDQDWIVSQGFIDAQGNRSTDGVIEAR